MHVPEIPGKAVLLIVDKNYKKYGDYYTAAYYAWRVRKSRVEKADYVFAVCDWTIREVFEATEWLPAMRNYFPDRDPMPGRYGFVGHEAPQEIQDLYVGMPVPDRMRTPGARNPVRYANC